MKKITVGYFVMFDTELPDDVFEEARKAQGLECGEKFNEAISKYSPEWKQLFNINTLEGEIEGVYNPYINVDGTHFGFAQPNDEKIYWEN